MFVEGGLTCVRCEAQQNSRVLANLQISDNSPKSAIAWRNQEKLRLEAQQQHKWQIEKNRKDCCSNAPMCTRDEQYLAVHACALLLVCVPNLHMLLLR